MFGADAYVTLQRSFDEFGGDHDAPTRGGAIARCKAFARVRARTVTLVRAAAQVPDAVPVEFLEERCDRCGGRAAHRVHLRAGYLYFCGRHYELYAPALAVAVAVPSSL